MVKRVYSRFDKWCEWVDEGPSTSGPVVARKFEKPCALQREETQSWVESGSAPTGVAKGPSGGAALEDLTQMVRDLQIAQARRDIGEQSRDRMPPVGQRCMWCDAVGHIQKECVDFVEALKTNVVYLWNGRVHASETQKALEMNTWRGGMKRLMEEAATRCREDSGP